MNISRFSPHATGQGQRSRLMTSCKVKVMPQCESCKLITRLKHNHMSRELCWISSSTWCKLIWCYAEKLIHKCVILCSICVNSKNRRNGMTSALRIYAFICTSMLHSCQYPHTHVCFYCSLAKASKIALRSPDGVWKKSSNPSYCDMIINNIQSTRILRCLCLVLNAGVMMNLSYSPSPRDAKVNNTRRAIYREIWHADHGRRCHEFGIMTLTL
jgi:hypothetical protein